MKKTVSIKKVMKEHKVLMDELKLNKKIEMKKEYTYEELMKMAIQRYGDDIHLWAKQRDGFIVGFQKAMEQVKKHGNDWIDTKERLPEPGTRVLIIRDTRRWDKERKVFVDIADVGYFEKEVKIGGPQSLTGHHYLQGVYFAVPAILHPDSVTYWKPIPDISNCL